jgi:hypothetical protein
MPRQVGPRGRIRIADEIVCAVHRRPAIKFANSAEQQRDADARTDQNLVIIILSLVFPCPFEMDELSPSVGDPVSRT